MKSKQLHIVRSFSSAMRNLFSLLLVLAGVGAQRTIQWTFVQNGSSGVIPVELITISPTLMLMYDRADGNPLLLPDGEKAWAALWNLETNTPTPLSSLTDTFCAAARYQQWYSCLCRWSAARTSRPTACRCRLGIRLFGPCTSPTGENCHIHLAVTRWYPTGLRIPDGSLMIIGGSNIIPSITRVRPRRTASTGTVRPSQFLLDAEPVNMFPRSFVLPSGRVFVIANNITMIYDIETNTETRLPEIPNGVRVANPFDGSAQLLPLSPPLYEPTVLVCGGSAADDTRPVTNLTTKDPATNQCSRITLTRAGIAKGWENIDGECYASDRRLLLINGAHTGQLSFIVPDIRDIRVSAAPTSPDRTQLTLQFPAGQRIIKPGLPTSNIARMYHSSASLTAKELMVAGSNPHPAVVLPPTTFPTEFRVERSDANSFNQKTTLKVTVPQNLLFGQIRVRLDLVHAHSIGNNLEITAPPNNNIYPPGPAWLFLVADGVYSEECRLWLAWRRSSETDQGVKIPITSL
ncbi:glyoxal oxidase precursor [Mycena leptocephala]|nr:glyoxal oxidase precursor [Mycena leptocephala]